MRQWISLTRDYPSVAQTKLLQNVRPCNFGSGSKIATACLSAIAVKLPAGREPIGAGGIFPCPGSSSKKYSGSRCRPLECWVGRAGNQTWWRCWRGLALTAPRAAKRRGRWMRAVRVAQPVRRGRTLDHAVAIGKTRAPAPIAFRCQGPVTERVCVGCVSNSSLPQRRTIRAVIC